jgi:hypothetical protein
MQKKTELKIHGFFNWLKAIDLNYNNLFNFYLYDFYKKPIFFDYKKENEFAYYTEFFTRDYWKNITTYRKENSAENKGKMHELKSYSVKAINNIVRENWYMSSNKNNELVVYFWIFMIFFYFAWLWIFFKVFMLSSKRNLHHIMRILWFFIILIFSVLNIKIYFSLIYNNLYTSRFLNGRYLRHETRTLNKESLLEFRGERRLKWAINYHRTNIKIVNYYWKCNVNYRDILFLNICWKAMVARILMFDDIVSGVFFIDYLICLILFCYLYYIGINFIIKFKYKSIILRK